MLQLHSDLSNDLVNLVPRVVDLLHFVALFLRSHQGASVCNKQR